MFEVRAYIGSYRKGGFVSYEDAARHAQEKADADGQPYWVSEIIDRCLIKSRKKVA